MKIKVLFLDFDGVLFTGQGCHYWQRLRKKEKKPEKELCPIAMSNLQYILEQVHNAKIVISSTWRHIHDLKFFNKLLWGEVIGMTPTLPRGSGRGKEIFQWLVNTKEDIENFIIIDDDSDMAPFQNLLIKTDSRTGLMYDKAVEAIKMLGQTRGITRTFK